MILLRRCDGCGCEGETVAPHGESQLDYCALCEIGAREWLEQSIAVQNRHYLAMTADLNELRKKYAHSHLPFAQVKGPTLDRSG